MVAVPKRVSNFTNLTVPTGLALLVTPTDPSPSDAL